MPIETVREKLDAQEFEDAKAIIGLRKLLACLDREEDTTLLK